MTPEEWQSVKVQLHELLINDPGLRAHRLALLAREYPTLRDELDELVSSFDSMTPDYLDPSAQTWAVDTIGEATDSPLRGIRIGPYEIAERIASGGMGEVFRAVQIDDAAQPPVAIKIIRSGQDSPAILSRFRQERRILGGLDHPNIARMLNAGTSDQGLPYFVMELIDGSRLLEYCETQHLSIEERLRLFILVCRAVHYAHQHGVIHRDIKPSNILVTQEGEPKLLDFGIAKLLDVESGITVSATMSLFRPLTPAYASPEQVRGDPITHSTDIYSLGVVLYELLCGRGPYGLVEPSSDALARAVCGTQPVPPSQILFRAEGKVTPGDGRRFRGMGSNAAAGSAAAWRKRDGTDLDTIVLCALRKEPERRYPSTEAFAQDVGAFLEGGRISARKDSLSYRAARFGRGHLALAVCAALLIVVTGAVVGMLIRSAHRPVEVASTSLNPVQVRRSIAVIGFKADSSAVSPWASTAISEMISKTMAAGGQVRAVSQELVARGKKDLALPDSEFYDQKQLSQIRRALHTDYAVFGSFVESPSQIRLDLRAADTRSDETVASVSESGPPAQLIEMALRAGTRMRQRLGLSDLAESERKALAVSFPSGREAIRAYAEGLQKLNRLDSLGANQVLLLAVKLDPSHALSHAALSNSWSLLGFDQRAASEAQLAMDHSAALARNDQLAIQGRYYSALHQDDKALEIYRTLFGLYPDDIEYGLRLADFESTNGKGHDALTTVAALRKLPDPIGQDPRIDLAEASAAGSIGDFHHELDAATAALRDAQLGGARSLIAFASNRQAIALVHLKDIPRATSAFQAALAMYQEMGDIRGASSAFNGLATTLYHSGDLAGARHDLEQAISGFDKIGDRKSLVRSMTNLATVIGDMGDLDGSMKMYLKLLKKTREVDSKHEVAESLNNIGTIEVLQGELAKAEDHFQQALAVFRDQRDLNYVARGLDSLGTAQLLQGNVNDAIHSFTEEVSQFKQLGDEASAGMGLCNLGQALTEYGDLAAAEKTLNDGLTITRKGGDHPYEAQATSSLALVYLYQGKLDRSRKNYEKALAMRDASGEKYTDEENRLALAEVLLQQGQWTQAETMTNQALKELETEHMKDDQIMALALLARVASAQHQPRKAGENLQLAERMAARSQNPGARFSLVLAKGESAHGSLSPRLIQELQTAIAEAHRRAILAYEFRLRLVLASNGAAKGETSNCGQLKTLHSEAEAKGFGRIAEMSLHSCP